MIVFYYVFLKILFFVHTCDAVAGFDNGDCVQFYIIILGKSRLAIVAERERERGNQKI